jgi:hypothetical protein
MRKTLRRRVRTEAKRGARVWGYGYAQLAELLGTSEDAVRQQASRGVLDPSKLESICARWAETKKEELLRRWNTERLQAANRRARDAARAAVEDPQRPLRDQKNPYGQP